MSRPTNRTSPGGEITADAHRPLGVAPDPPADVDPDLLPYAGWTPRPLGENRPQAPVAVPPSPADVLTPSQAAVRLPWRKATALGWLRTSGLVREVNLGDGSKPRTVVVWGDVLRRLGDPLGGGGRFLG